jgi:Sulfotransferase family
VTRDKRGALPSGARGGMHTIKGADVQEEFKAPLVIGGVGGSGTRVYRSIVEAAGYSMLTTPLPHRLKTDKHHDNYPLSRFFYNRWIDPYVAGELDQRGSAQMRLECRAWLFACSPTRYGRGRWGWKNPRASFLVPFFHELYPSMWFIHVVRDGRDHAFHPSFPYTKHMRVLLSPEEQQLPDHVRKGLAWARRHQLVREQSARLLPGRHLSSRLEDLCADPEREIRRIYDFLGLEADSIVERAAQLVRTPASLGRWQAESADRLAEAEEAMRDELEHYGYPLHTTT